jgi:plasmid segregation protein ParM
MSPSVVVGFDPGNSEATLLLTTGTRNSVLTIPSYIGAGSLDELRRIRGGSGKQDKLDVGEFVLETAERSMFVGRLALEQSSGASSARGDISRYWHGHTLHLLMVLGGTLIKDTTFSLRVVTGLPVNVWNKQTTVAAVQRSLCGTHTFTLNGRERTMMVEGVLVMMEGAGALAAYGSAEDVPQAVIDTGGRTTDLFWARGMQPVLPRCAGFALGVEQVGDALADWFRTRYERELAPHELRALLRAYAQKEPPPPLYADGAPVILNGELQAFASAVGGDIRREVSRLWRSSEQGKVAAEAARVLYIGGGPYFFRELLRPIIPHLEVPRAPELANAQGYLAVGQQLPETAWMRLRP